MNRRERIHVVNVRHDKNKNFYVVLSDGSEIPWNTWVNSGARI